jgi:hypothetical protein
MPDPKDKTALSKRMRTESILYFQKGANTAYR